VRGSLMNDICEHRLLQYIPFSFRPRSTFREKIGPFWIVTISQSHSGMRISRHFSLPRLTKFSDSRTSFPLTTVDPHCPSFQIMPGLLSQRPGRLSGKRSHRLMLRTKKNCIVKFLTLWIGNDKSACFAKTELKFSFIQLFPT
jgi:hypothetical protein